MDSQGKRDFTAIHQKTIYVWQLNKTKYDRLSQSAVLNRNLQLASILAIVKTVTAIYMYEVQTLDSLRFAAILLVAQSFH